MVRPYLGAMPGLEIFQFPCLQDNFGVLVHEPDPGRQRRSMFRMPAPSAQHSEERGWNLSHVFTTHHHGDHTDGNAEIKERTGARIVGPAHDSRPSRGSIRPLKGGDRFRFGRFEVLVIDTPGHTQGHIAFHIPEAASPSSAIPCFHSDAAA